MSPLDSSSSSALEGNSSSSAETTPIDNSITELRKLALHRSSHSTINTVLSFEDSEEDEEEEEEELCVRQSTTPNANTTASINDCDAMRLYHTLNQEVEPWMQRAWIVHFVVGAAVLGVSVWSNGGESKYIPVDPSRNSSGVDGMGDMTDCYRAFVNVLSSSSNEPGALICCSSSNNNTGGDLFSLCPTPPNQEPLPLPFLGRLAKFPDAWLIPLFPLLLRVAFRTYQTVLEKGHLMLDTTFGVYSFRRLVLYFCLMQFRGWVLYMAFNSIEDSLVNTTTNQSGGVQQQHQLGENETMQVCWYRDWLPESQQTTCYGRRFDFSDHVVLYFAQLLPIALLEYLHSIHRPYWPFHFFRRIALPLVLTMGMLYLYFITYVGVYKTAAYFHTPQESLTGYAVSLLAHVPLCALQCSNAVAMVKIREYFFGPKTRALLR